MFWIEPPKFDLTANAKLKMKQYDLNKNDLLSIFNSFDKEIIKRKNLYWRLKKWGKYTAGISLYWDFDERRWVINSCWKFKTWEYER